MIAKYSSVILLIILCSLLMGCATNYANRPQVQQFINQMAVQHQFNPIQLNQLFHQIKPDPKIIQALHHPNEKTLRWDQYRSIFVTEKRAKEGAQFWQEHAKTLAYAEQQYGVPAPIIIAIIGVETCYGLNEGQHNALRSLTTLAFDYPPREQFFRNELTQYLLLTRDNQLNPLALKSSYAGALGLPQFMPSSYREYAKDYDTKGYSNLFTNADDAIISVANYFQAHGWKQDGLIAIPISTTKIPRQYKSKANLIILTTKYGHEYWLGFHNFDVILRYNSSPMYAMAVYQLSRSINHYHRSQ